jgi:hypothetical protein
MKIFPQKSFFFFISIIQAFFMLSCTKKKQVEFATNNMPRLYTQGSSYAKTAKGVFSLSGPGNYEYQFLSPLIPQAGSSLEVEYYVEFPDAAYKGGYGDNFPLTLSLGSMSWELPVDLSFLGGLAMVRPGTQGYSVVYAIPLPEKSLETLSFRYHAQEKQNEKNAPLLQIKSLRLVDTWLGFSRISRSQDNSITYALSPFVYIQNSKLIIDPPEQLKNSGGLEMRILMDGGTVLVNTGRQRIESFSGELKLPSVFLKKDNFPLFIEKGESVKEAVLSYEKKKPFPSPLPADPEMILAWPQKAWRDPALEIFSMQKFPSILIFDMADYSVQDLFLKRIAFFVEKANYRGSVVTFSEIEGLHGWNAHDYPAAALANFFEAVRKDNIPLIKEEAALKNILLNAGLIRIGPRGEIVPGEGVILSISRESPDYLRTNFMVHEVFHGIYFEDRDFRDFCRSRWDAFDDPARHFLLTFFRYKEYDTSDNELMENEFMAYLLQQSVSRLEAYFRGIFANRELDFYPWDRTSLPGVLATLKAEAEVFSSYVKTRWGYEAGRVRSVTIR